MLLQKSNLKLFEMFYFPQKISGTNSNAANSTNIFFMNRLMEEISNSGLPNNKCTETWL